MGRLKTLDRETLVAFYIRGLSLVEIAEELEVPLGTVKRRLHTARKRLRTELVAAASDAEEWIDGAAQGTEQPDEDEDALQYSCSGKTGAAW